MNVPSAARWTAALIARNKLIAGSIAVFAVAAIVVSLLTSSSTSLPPAPAAAGFSMTALDAPGQHISLSQYKDKPVIVNFWASWCTDCQTETPLLASWYKQQHGHIDLVGLDENDITAKALTFAQAKGITYPLGFDPLTSAAGAYGVNALPQTFFLNAQHRVVQRVFGAVTKAELAQGVSLMNASGTPGEKVIQPS
jgi:cytochrome c biogenesis protein CcmG, thiol:disulfide interchange protein DsbE